MKAGDKSLSFCGREFLNGSQPVVLERLGKLLICHRVRSSYAARNAQSAPIQRPNTAAVRRYVSGKIALSTENERKLGMIACFCGLDGGYNPKRRIIGMQMHMPKSSLDDITIEVICGTCGTGQSRPIGYFRNHSHLTCDGCGSEITVENEKFRASIAEFGRTMARLREPYLH